MTTTSASLSTTSTSGLGLTGLSSGLDTSGIITKLMAIESQPQTNLKTQLSGVTTYTTALQSLNGAVASVASNAATMTAAGALVAFSATSDSSAVTPTASATASTGSLSFSVAQLAQAQTSATGALSSWPDTSSAKPSITIQIGTGPTATTKTVTAASTNLDDVVSAINAGGTGVTATKVTAGTDASGAPQYVLQMRSNSTGAAGAFTVFEGTDTSGTALPATRISTAQDASLTLYAGTAAEQHVTSSTNTFTGLLTGVDVKVSATTSTPVNLTIAPDSSKITAAASSLTTQMIALFGSIAASTAVTTGASASGGTSSSSTSGGVFTGDPSVRSLKDSMLAAVSGAVGTKSPSSIGINLTKDGTITFDQSAFTAAMASDPAGTTAMFQAISTRVGTAAKAASDPYTGSLTALVTSQQGQESSLTTQISDWDTRLAAIQTQYQTQFDALEVALNSLSSQSSYITSQIAGLTTNYQQT